jgi:hypothetical protein
MNPRATQSASTRLVGEAVGLSIGAVLAAIGALRRGKPVHPKGVVHQARLRVRGGAAAPPAARLLAEPAEHYAIVRFSRSLGVPRPLPDLFGMSIRIPDAYGRGRHQDLLLVTSADMPILRRMFVPATGVDKRPYTSALPYVAGHDRFIVGAVPRPSPPTAELFFELAVAHVGSGSRGFEPIADLVVGPRLPDALDALRFSPWNAGGGMAPAGILNGARHRAYALSQAAWRAARPDGADAQEAAERELAGVARSQAG